MKFMTLWITAKFWWLWGANALMAAGILYVFLSGFATGRVSSDNLLPWCFILLVTATIIGGSLWQKNAGHPGIAVLPLLAALIPAVLAVVGALLWFVFYTVVFITGNGRMN